MLGASAERKRSEQQRARTLTPRARQNVPETPTSRGPSHGTHDAARLGSLDEEPETMSKMTPVATAAPPTPNETTARVLAAPD